VVERGGGQGGLSAHPVARLSARQRNAGAAAGEAAKVVSQRLGHAHVSVTMGIYQHVTAQDDQAVADTLGRPLDGG
jgi:integrase